MLAATVGAAGASTVGTITAFGVTYTLSSVDLGGNVTQFTLDISGINVVGTDTEGGRIGVRSFAFSDDGITGLVAPTGFSYYPGGLGDTGCSNNSGNFYCFTQYVDPNGSPLASGSTLSYVFYADTDSIPVDYLPSFKIDWIGTKSSTDGKGVLHSGYDNVSLQLIGVPLPGSLPLLGSGLILAGFLASRRRKSAA